MNFIKENWLLFLSLIYIISPIDFIPELLVGPLGLIDDFWLVVFLILGAFLKYRKRGRKSPHVIEGEVQ